MKKLLLIIGLLLLGARPAAAQYISAQSHKQAAATSQTITSDAAGTAVDVTGYSAALVTVRGTYVVVSIDFQVSPDATNYFPVACARVDSAAVETGSGALTNTTRAWRCNVTGFTRFRHNSDWTSGTVNLTITPVAAASDLGVTVSQTTAANLNATVTGTVNSAQSGTWTVQPGNTANTTAWKVDGSAVTQPVSASSLPLPTGAATSAKQPALGTAGSASSDVITVQGIASGTALRVDGSAVTQPVSASSLPLPTGAATESTLSTLNTKINTEITSDYDTGGGTQTMKLAGLALPSSGGAVAGGTSSNPIRTDPTGSTTQPVSGTVTANAGSGTFTVSGTVTANAGTNLNTSALALESGGNLATVAGVVRAEDAASADAHTGIPALAVRKATPANTSGTDGDYENLQMSAGRLWISALIDTALPAGSNVIGGVTQSGTWNVGTVTAVTAISNALPAGTNNIGDVDVLTVPSDPFGSNADAASATGSISAKLRFIASTGIPITGTVTVGSHAVTNAGTFATQPAGSVAHDAVGTSVNPILLGGYASAAAPTDVSADGDSVRAWYLRSGAAVVQPTYGGVLQSTGNGTAGTGTPRVTIASDNTAFTVNAAQSGTWTVQPGNTANTTAWLVDARGNVASGATDSGNPVKVAGKYNSTPITLTDGQRGDVQLDTNGYIKVNVAAGGGAGGTSSSFGSAFPSSGTALGLSDGTNMQAGRAVDADSGGGTQYVQGVNLLKRASGGAVEAGTASDPIRTDPTGSTTQPVSGTVTANAGSGTFTVSGTVTANAGTNLNTSALALESGGNLATLATAIRTEDGPTASGHGGVPTLAVRVNSPANTSDAANDYEFLQMNNGRLYTSTTIDAALPAGSNVIGALSANQSVNVAQINGATPLMGNGASGTGAQRVTIANDSTGILAGVTTVTTVSTVSALTGGGVAHDGADSGNPIKVGARAVSAPITAVANNDRTDLVADLTGRQIVAPYSNPENLVTGVTSAITNTSDTSVIAAGGAGVRNYINSLSIINSHATVATVVELKDGSTVIWRGYAAAAGGGFTITFPAPLRGTANTAINCAAVTTGANVYCSAAGYRAP